MSNIMIDGHGTTARSIKTLEEMIKNGQVNPGDYFAVNINYNAHVGLGQVDTPEFYPVKFYGIRQQELWISYVTTGYAGEGPCGTQKALRLMGFDTVAADETLLFEQKVINETFYKEAGKDDRIEYHYDLMHEATERLCKILDDGISEEAIKQFESVAFDLKWEGNLARNFRRKTSEITSELRFRTPTENDIAFLRELADYPRKCADAMAAKDQEIADRIGRIISAMNG